LTLPYLIVFSHYFPALYFAIIALCQTYDFTFARFHLGVLRKPVVGQTAAVAFLAIAIFVFTQYAPLVYGNQWTQDECKKVKLFNTWDWDCNSFLTSYEAYANAPSSVDSHIPASAAPAGGNPEQPKNDAQVTPQAEKAPQAFAGDDGPRVVGREEKVEYRDEHGNLLNDEQVAELKGKVEFQVCFPLYR
jgi:dolichyl-phosphate-mannose-protein mannosyltransferase